MVFYAQWKKVWLRKIFLVRKIWTEDFLRKTENILKLLELIKGTIFNSCGDEFKRFFQIQTFLKVLLRKYKRRVRKRKRRGWIGSKLKSLWIHKSFIVFLWTLYRILNTSFINSKIAITFSTFIKPCFKSEPTVQAQSFIVQVPFKSLSHFVYFQNFFQYPSVSYNRFKSLTKLQIKSLFQSFLKSMPGNKKNKGKTGNLNRVMTCILESEWCSMRVDEVIQFQWSRCLWNTIWMLISDEKE